MPVPPYRERLLPRWWAWLVAYALVGMLAVAYGAALGPRAGWAVAAAGGALATWILWISAPVVAADHDGLRAGGATLPSRSIASVEVVDRARIADLRGPGADARVFAVLRPWAASGGVLVTLSDAADPHPSWLVSARRPARVASALAHDDGTAENGTAENGTAEDGTAPH